MTDLTWSEYAVIKTELRNRMPAYHYRQNVFVAQVEFLNRVPVGCRTCHAGGVYLGVAVPLVVVNHTPRAFDPYQAD